MKMNQYPGRSAFGNTLRGAAILLALTGACTADRADDGDKERPTPVQFEAQMADRMQDVGTDIIALAQSDEEGVKVSVVHDPEDENSTLFVIKRVAGPTDDTFTEYYAKVESRRGSMWPFQREDIKNIMLTRDVRDNELLGTDSSVFGEGYSFSIYDLGQAEGGVDSWRVVSRTRGEENASYFENTQTASSRVQPLTPEIFDDKLFGAELVLTSMINGQSL